MDQDSGMDATETNFLFFGAVVVIKEGKTSWAPFHRAALEQKVAKHNKIMVTRIQLPTSERCRVFHL